MPETDYTDIFVLTDTPGLYGEELHYNGRPPIFVHSIDDLIKRLRDVSLAGLVLEVEKVMKAKRMDRDRLFNYSTNFPLLRTRTNARHGFVLYLDQRESFFHNLESAAGKRERSHIRMATSLPCVFSRENDPIMSVTIEGQVRDISPGGCFIQTHAPLEREQFLHLRIPQFSNARPIFSSIRWTRRTTSGDQQPGMGIMFIDLSEDQLEDILALQNLAG